MDKYYKLIKLTNGDDIIATTDTDCKNFKKEKSIFVCDPVLVDKIRISQGPYMVETYTMQPWIKLAKDDIIEIPTENIMVAVDIEDKVQEQYDTFLYESKSEDDQTVQEFTEDQLDQLMESFEDIEDDDDHRHNRDTNKKQGPTLH